LQTGTHL
jgi:hypothetical protein